MAEPEFVIVSLINTGDVLLDEKNLIVTDDFLIFSLETHKCTVKYPKLPLKNGDEENMKIFVEGKCKPLPSFVDYECNVIGQTGNLSKLMFLLYNYNYISLTLIYFFQIHMKLLKIF